MILTSLSTEGAHTIKRDSAAVAEATQPMSCKIAAMSCHMPRGRFINHPANASPLHVMWMAEL